MRILLIFGLEHFFRCEVQEEQDKFRLLNDDVMVEKEFLIHLSTLEAPFGSNFPAYIW